MNIGIIELQSLIKQYEKDFEYLKDYEGEADKKTVVAGLKLLGLVSKKFGMYNSIPSSDIDDANLCEEVCKLNFNELKEISENNIYAGSVSVVRHIVAEELIKSPRRVIDSDPSTLTALISEIKEKFWGDKKDYKYFEKYYLSDTYVHPDILLFIKNYDRGNPFQNWGAQYRYLLPFIYNNEIKNSIWNALEAIIWNLLFDLKLANKWECKNSKGWGNNVRSYYGFEGPSNYGSQRAVLMLHPKEIPDHKNSAQLVCYFYDGFVAFGSDLGINAKKILNINNAQQLQEVEIFGKKDEEVLGIYEKIKACLSERLEEVEQINEKLISKAPAIKLNYIVEGDAKYSETDDYNLYDDNTSTSALSDNGGNSGNNKNGENDNNANNGDADNGNSGGGYMELFGNADVLKIFPNLKVDEDYLERFELAGYLANNIFANRAIEPLNIGLYGDWGNGKTQIFNLIKECLNKSNKNLKREKWRRFLFTPHNHWIDNIKNWFNVLFNLAEDVTPKEVVIIDFDAWKYNEQDRIWASLVVKIMNECKKDPLFYFKFKLWEFFRYLLNNAGELFFKTLFVLTIFASILHFDLLFMNSDGKYNFVYSALKEFSLIDRVLLAVVFAVAPDILKPLWENIEKVFAGCFKASKCEEMLGLRQEIENLVGYALQYLCARGKKRVVLFIDNLDRCSSANIKEILDSICQFLEMTRIRNIPFWERFWFLGKEFDAKQPPVKKSGEDVKPERCKMELFTVFAMDKGIIIDALKQEKIASEKVENYLEKIINLPIYPSMPNNIDSYIVRFFGKAKSKLRQDLVDLYSKCKYNPRRLANLRYFVNLCHSIDNRILEKDEIEKILLM